jgi:hypothetical protein
MARIPLTVTRHERGRRVREFRPGQRADTLEAVLANARSGPPTATRRCAPMTVDTMSTCCRSRTSTL